MLTTTLFELVSAVQDVTEDDALAVAVVDHIVNGGEAGVADEAVTERLAS